MLARGQLPSGRLAACYAGVTHSTAPDRWLFRAGFAFVARVKLAIRHAHSQRKATMARTPVSQPQEQPKAARRRFLGQGLLSLLAGFGAGKAEANADAATQ